MNNEHGTKDPPARASYVLKFDGRRPGSDGGYSLPESSGPGMPRSASSGSPGSGSADPGSAGSGLEGSAPGGPVFERVSAGTPHPGTGEEPDHALWVGPRTERRTHRRGALPSAPGTSIRGREGGGGGRGAPPPAAGGDQGKPETRTFPGDALPPAAPGGRKPFRISREIVGLWAGAAIIVLLLLIGYGGPGDRAAPSRPYDHPTARALYWVLPGIRPPAPGGGPFEGPPYNRDEPPGVDDGAIPAFGAAPPEAWEAGSGLPAPDGGTDSAGTDGTYPDGDGSGGGGPADAGIGGPDSGAAGESGDGTAGGGRPPGRLPDGMPESAAGTPGESWLSRWLQSVTGMSGLKYALRTAIPGMAAMDPPSSPWASEALTPGYLLVSFFEEAGGVAIGQPWTLLASELPALGMVELPERNVPLVVDPSLLAPDDYFPEPLEPGRDAVGAGGHGPPFGGENGVAGDPGADGDGGPGEDGSPAAGGEQGDSGGGSASGGAGGDGGALGGGEPSAEGPAVFIYHSHGTEAFLGAIPAGAGINPNVSGFSPDPGRSIIRVGAEIQRLLEEEYGIGAIHATDLFDWQDGRVTRIGSYYRSLQMLENFGGTGRSIVEEHPSLQIVMDLHRDAIPRKMSIVDIDGETAARLLFIVGTRHHGHPDWEDNLCFATVLHELAEDLYPGVSRGVMQRPGDRFNQHIMPGALLVEVGSVENTLEEALRSARIVAELIHEAMAAELTPSAGEPYSCPASGAGS